METHLLYVTSASVDEARRISRALVEARLVACVNIIEGMTSIYQWEGVIKEGQEVVLIDGGNQEFLRWIGDKVN
jgi:periplasmic divalent cation tolerance protein